MTTKDYDKLEAIPFDPAHIISPVLEQDTYSALIDAALTDAAVRNKISHVAAVAGIFSLERFQSPLKRQNNRGTCWAFAGAAALEAAYCRKYNLEIDVSEEYIFHMGKAFALNRDAQGNVVQPVENNSSLTGFQGSGDIVKKLTENAVPPEATAPYLTTQQNLLNILPVLGYPNQQALTSQADFDAIEFCEQHIPLLARVNARYRATDWGSLGGNPSVEALENTLLAEREVVCDVTHKTAPIGGHALLLIGFDRNRKVFFAKNHWIDNRFIEIQYENDPEWSIDTGWFIKDVVDPTFVQNEACWLGNWWLTIGGSTVRLLLRRSEDFASPGAPTRMGSAYLGDGPHDVNGLFLDGGGHIRLFIAPTTAQVPAGELSGTQIDAWLDFSDIYNVAGVTGTGQPVRLSRFATRFAALFEQSDGSAWQARHGLDAANHQATFDALLQQGFRMTSVCGYSEGRDARYNSVWVQRSGGPWQARHGLTSNEYQATFNDLVQQGYRLTNVSGYAIDGQARYAAIWEQRPGPDWQARHGMTGEQYQQTFNELAAQGFVLQQVSVYRVNVDVLFAAIWEKEDGLTWQVRHGLTSSGYQLFFDDMVRAGYRLAWVSGYSDTGIARYASVWRKEPSGPWQARHGLDADAYQREFDALAAQGFRPVQVSGYGDGFYPA